MATDGNQGSEPAVTGGRQSRFKTIRKCPVCGGTRFHAEEDARRRGTTEELLATAGFPVPISLVAGSVLVPMADVARVDVCCDCGAVFVKSGVLLPAPQRWARQAPPSGDGRR